MSSTRQKSLRNCHLVQDRNVSGQSIWHCHELDGLDHVLGCFLSFETNHVTSVSTRGSAPALDRGHVPRSACARGCARSEHRPTFRQDSRGIQRCVVVMVTFATPSNSSSSRMAWVVSIWCKTRQERSAWLLILCMMGRTPSATVSIIESLHMGKRSTFRSEFS